MDRRRPLAVIGALCAVLALQGAPAASAQVVGPGTRVVVTDLPVLSELPPLPAEGDAPVEESPVESEPYGMSAVQTVALVLAIGALVAGGTGLALVTRRRGEPPEDPDEQDPAPPRHVR